MTVGEVNSLLVGDLNKFVFMDVFKGYRLFLSFFTNTSLIDCLFALHNVTYSGICSYINNKSSFIVKIKNNQHKLMPCKWAQ